MLLPVYFIVILVIVAQVIPNQTYPAVPAFAPVPLASPSSPPVGLLAYAPNASADAATVMAAVAAAPPFAGVPVLGFATDDDLADYYLATSATGPPMAGVVFATNADGTLPPAVQVALRFSLTAVPSTLSVNTDPSACRATDPAVVQGTCGPQRYLTSGFASLQAAVAEGLTNLLLNATLGSAAAAANWTVQQFPLPEYTSQSTALSSLVAIYTVMAFSPLVQFLAVNVVYEKEHKIREHLFMMGGTCAHADRARGPGLWSIGRADPQRNGPCFGSTALSHPTRPVSFHFLLFCMQSAQRRTSWRGACATGSSSWSRP